MAPEMEMTPAMIEQKVRAILAQDEQVSSITSQSYGGADTWVARIEFIDGTHSVAEGVGYDCLFISARLKSAAPVPSVSNDLQSRAANQIREYRNSLQREHQRDILRQDTENRFGEGSSLEQLFRARE